MKICNGYMSYKLSTSAFRAFTATTTTLLQETLKRRTETAKTKETQQTMQWALSIIAHEYFAYLLNVEEHDMILRLPKKLPGFHSAYCDYSLLVSTNMNSDVGSAAKAQQALTMQWMYFFNLFDNMQ